MPPQGGISIRDLLCTAVHVNSKVQATQITCGTEGGGRHKVLSLGAIQYNYIQHQEFITKREWGFLGQLGRNEQ